MYLDTVVLIGGYSAKFSSFMERFVFGSGAGAASVVWFFALAYLGTKLRMLFHDPKIMARVSLVSGVLLLGMALYLGWEMSHWGISA